MPPFREAKFYGVPPRLMLPAVPHQKETGDDCLMVNKNVSKEN
jgi:hypothetical protein